MLALLQKLLRSHDCLVKFRRVCEFVCVFLPSINPSQKGLECVVGVIFAVQKSPCMGLPRTGGGCRARGVGPQSAVGVLRESPLGTFVSVLERPASNGGVGGAC